MPEAMTFEQLQAEIDSPDRKIELDFNPDELTRFVISRSWDFDSPCVLFIATDYELGNDERVERIECANMFIALTIVTSKIADFYNED